MTAPGSLKFDTFIMIKGFAVCETISKLKEVKNEPVPRS